MSDSRINWRDLIDTEEGREELISAHWQQLAAAAWDGYLREGRGALLLDLASASNAITNPGVLVERHYLPLDLLAEAGSQSGSDNYGMRVQITRLRTYDPRREIVLFILSSDGNCLRARCVHSDSAELLDPPEAHRAEKNARRNNPHLS